MFEDPAQSDAESVAWQYRWKMELFDGEEKWSPWHDIPGGCVERYVELPDYETRALYTVPPRPDASAGLIEAAGMAVAAATKLQNNKLGSAYDDYAAAVYLDFASKLRDRAADRSGHSAYAGSQDVRAKHAVYRIENECFGWDKSFNSEQAYWIIRSALAADRSGK